jgi:hypothetical protein
MFTDPNGKEHEVAITTARHDYWTAAGELRADCACGWWDHHPYSPGGQGYATLKLQFRAVDHVPAARTGGSR